MREVTYYCDQCSHTTRQKPGLEIWCSRETSHRRVEMRRMRPKKKKETQ